MMGVITEKLSYIGKLPEYPFGKTTGIFTTKDTYQTLLRRKIGASGAAIGYRVPDDGIVSTLDDFQWLSAGQSVSPPGTPWVLIYLPPDASGAISNYVVISHTSNFSQQNTYRISVLDKFSLQDAVSGSYAPSEWSLFTISSSAAVYTLSSGRFNRLASNGGISLTLV